MKLVTPNRLNNESGSVLATTLIITFVIGATLASFLVLTQNQTFANARSQSWNQSMAVTEAGVEDAMQMINKYNFDPTRLLEWSQDADNLLDGWQPFGTDAYRTFRWVGTDYRAGYYVVISNANPIAPNITAWGYLRYDYEFAKAPIATAAAGTTFAGFNSRYLTRQVYVNTRKDALWTLAMLADRQIDLNGNNISTDSFNSADTGASTYDVSKGFAVYALADRRDKGDVATNYRIVNSLNVSVSTALIVYEALRQRG